MHSLRTRIIFLTVCVIVIALTIVTLLSVLFIRNNERLESDQLLLLLCETGVRDLTPLTGLEELVYLELFLTPVRDLSPLLTLKSLEDLNLSYTQGDVDVVAQMTWLKNLWWCSREEAIPTKSQQQMLREALPDCNFNFVKQSSTGGGWRELPNYYAQRDILGMYYMTG